jgi:hypothetical protein
MAIGDLSALTIQVGGINLACTANVTCVELNVYEDMESPTGPMGDVYIIDAADVRSKIFGGESVALSWTSSDFSSSCQFNLSNMEGTDYKPGSSQGLDGHGGGSLYHKEYHLKFCHSAFVTCQGNYVNGDFNDLCSDIVSQVVTYAFGTSCSTPDPTTPVHRMIARFEHPLKFIDRVIDDSISAGYLSSLYVLYFNRSTFVYQTYESAFNNGSSGVTLTMKNTLRTSTALYQDKLNQIMWFDGQGFYRPSRPQNKGYVVTYNMSTGVVTQSNPFDVGYPWKINSGVPIYSAAPGGTTGIPQFYYLNPENTPDTYGMTLAEAKIYRLAFQSQLAQDAISWECVGNPAIKIGATITLNIPSMAYPSEQTEGELAGTFLVTSINHKIRAINETPRYTMICKGIKAAYNTVGGGTG